MKGSFQVYLSPYKKSNPDLGSHHKAFSLYWSNTKPSFPSPSGNKMKLKNVFIFLLVVTLMVAALTPPCHAQEEQEPRAIGVTAKIIAKGIIKK